MTVRVRFAPSPTGKLHIGGARTALFNWAHARRNGGSFVLRIEDTDEERSTAAFEDAILDGLRWLGLDWDEGPDVGGALGPYRQSQRADTYREAVCKLLQQGVAYRCFCSEERLSELRDRQKREGLTPAYDGACRELDESTVKARKSAGEPCVIRFRVPEGETGFDDMIRGHVRFPNQEVDDWIMVRASGAPTYNFVVVCDDAAMQISHVMRGEEHLTNTPKQVLLYRALDLPQPVFVHFPLILGKDKKKLSKRTGDTALEAYRDRGFPPEAVVNFLCLQGWALDDKTDVFGIEQFVERFDPAQVGKAGAIFDPDKFLWMAGEYVRMESPERLAERCAPFVVEAGLMSAEQIAQRQAWYVDAVRTEQERIRLYSDLPGNLAYLFADDEALSFAQKAEKNSRKHAEREATLADYLGWLRPRIEGGGDEAELRDATREWIQGRGMKMPALFQPLRCALTGKAGGPDLFEVMGLLGPERTIRRIELGIERLR